MASSEPPKKEGQGKGVPKKEALDARVTELSTSLQEMMADGETSGQESSANETTLTTRRTDPSWSALTDGFTPSRIVLFTSTGGKGCRRTL